MWFLSTTKDFYYIKNIQSRTSDILKKIHGEKIQDCKIRMIEKCTDKRLFNLYANDFFMRLIQNIPLNITLIIRLSSIKIEHYDIAMYQVDNDKYTNINNYIVKPKKLNIIT